MKRRSSLGTLRNKCDATMQEIGRARHKKCLLCTRPQQVMHHFIPKSVSSRLRYDWDNLIPLCNGCHNRLHQSGDPEYELRIREIRGKKWHESLRKRRDEYQKVNKGYYETVYAELQKELSTL